LKLCKNWFLMSDTERIDKYLWAIRAYKTRSDATEACKGNKVQVNGVNAKPSKVIKPGDAISVRKGAVLYSYKVLKPLSSRVGAQAVGEYAENLTPQSELDKARAPKETFFVRRERGSGRPTKKDRREIDELAANLTFEPVGGFGEAAEAFGDEDEGLEELEG